MILDANERERLARQAQELFLTQPTDYAAAVPALRQAGIGRDCLKAVLTPHNRTWTAVKLYQELLREHQAMNGR